jgi:hypothetical protein
MILDPTRPRIKISYIGAQETLDPDVSIPLFNVVSSPDEATFPVGTTISETTIQKSSGSFRFLREYPMDKSYELVTSEPYRSFLLSQIANQKSNH